MFRTANEGTAIFGMTADLDVNNFVFMLLIHLFAFSDESAIVRLRKLAACNRFAVCKFEDERVLVHVRVYPFGWYESIITSLREKATRIIRLHHSTFNRIYILLATLAEGNVEHQE